MKINYETGHEELISRIAPLWEKQREYHEEISEFFSKDLHDLTFPERIETIRKRNGFIEFYIIMVHDNEKDVGFILCSHRSDGTGEINSLYILPEYRYQNIATELMELAMEWLKQRCDVIQLVVSVGNERVLDFYKNFDFYPKNIQLQYKPQRK